MNGKEDSHHHTADRTAKFEKLIEKFERLKKDLIPTEEKLNAELAKVRQLILQRARANLSFTGDRLKDLCIIRHGKEFRENYEQLLRLRSILANAVGEYVLIHDTSYNLLINAMKETDRCYIPFRVAALGILESDPLDVGYEHDITGDRYYLKLRFHDGSYIRELESTEHPNLDKWINVLPTFRGRGGGYTEKSEGLKLVLPVKDYESSENYIRQIYIDHQESEDDLGQGLSEGHLKMKSKKPYWRIAPAKFEMSRVTIGSDPVIEIFEKQEFPEKVYKVFALYVGNEAVTDKLDLDVRKSGSLQEIAEILNSSRGKPGGKSLVF
jgi:hypothetical protein